MSARPSTPSDEGPAYGSELEGFSYPCPALNFEFVCQGIPPDMAYMDIKPTTPDGRVVILLRGKNYVAATGFSGQSLKSFKAVASIHGMAAIIDEFRPLQDLPAFRELHGDVRSIAQ